MKILIAFCAIESYCLDGIAYLSALGQILGQKAACLAACGAKLAGLDKQAGLKERRHKAEERLREQVKEIQALVHDNAKRAQNQEQYRMRYGELASAIEKQKELVERLKTEQMETIAAREKLRRFMRAVEACEDAAQFHPEVWNDTVERGVVLTSGEIVWEMMSGEKIRVKVRDRKN